MKWKGRKIEIEKDSKSSERTIEEQVELTEILFFLSSFFIFVDNL